LLGTEAMCPFENDYKGESKKGRDRSCFALLYNIAPRLRSRASVSRSLCHVRET
jgi:hypothetical protein